MWKPPGRSLSVSGGPPGDSHTLSRVPQPPAATAQPSLQALQAQLPTGIPPTTPEPELSQNSFHGNVPVLPILSQV